MEILIVHLTDIHIETNGDFDILIDRCDSISKAIMLHVTNAENKIIFLCITGDITNSGKKEQFDNASLFIGEIIDLIKKRYSKLIVQIVVIPGNHDCDFDDEFASSRNILLNNINMSEEILPSVMKSYTSIQKAYFNYVESLNCVGAGFGCQNDKILTENTFCFDEKGIVLHFHCINTAWCSSKHEEKGKLHFVINDEFEKKKMKL